MNAWSSYKDIREDPNFIDNYQYINFDILKFLNTSIAFLTVISIYSILSPLLNLLAPLLLLIVPFLILRLKGLTLTLGNYWRFLVISLQKHSFGKLLTDWSILPWSQKIYMLIMLGMYIYNIYQNAISCYQFYKNTGKINQDIKNIKNFLDITRYKVSTFINKIDKLETYSGYKTYLQEKLENINELYQNLNKVPIASFHPKKFTNIGYTMQQYYQLYDSEKINSTMLFSFGFWGFQDNIGEISSKINNKKINKTTFVKNNKSILNFKKAFYPTLQSQTTCNKNIPNDISLNKNKIITGPNASGKTSILKTTISNLLLSQQFGYGYYQKAKITPFDYIHCYLNIPDTSSRDSLFQAEARRCLTILNKINQNKTSKHFCIFDELFSGTNPYEAVSSATAYLRNISTNKNVKFMLTTHFISLCRKLKTDENIDNVNMKTEMDDNKPKYFYKLQNGISEIKGAITVLKDLGYPENLINQTKDIIEKL
jgi:DNA mismatch repair ATPase MutS